MKIYFVGAHSCGKTTLARFTSEKYQLPFLNEVARTILAEKELHLDSLRVDLDVVDEYQKSVFVRQISEEKKFDKFVSDRSLDCLAYAAQHSRILSELIHSEELKTYVEALRKDDVRIFFVRPSQATVRNDGVRERVNWEGIVAIDAIVKCLLEQFNLNYIIINTDSMQERVKIIESVLSSSQQIKK